VPHGGELVNCRLEGVASETEAARATALPVLELTARTLSDVEMIAIGGYSPLRGFMKQADYSSVVTDMRLANGLPWSISITLPVGETQAGGLAIGQEVALAIGGTRVATVQVEEVYRRDRAVEAERVYRTQDKAQPGVAALNTESDWVVAGPIRMFAPVPGASFPEYRLTPAQTRDIITRRAWRTVVGFQTRNPVHRAHEYLQKVALEQVDGLLLHPLVGETKGDDIPAYVRMKCYEALIENNYPPGRVLLSVCPASMRYAGRREVAHAAPDGVVAPEPVLLLAATQERLVERSDGVERSAAYGHVGAPHELHVTILAAQRKRRDRRRLTPAGARTAAVERCPDRAAEDVSIRR